MPGLAVFAPCARGKSVLADFFSCNKWAFPIFQTDWIFKSFIIFSISGLAFAFKYSIL